MSLTKSQQLSFYEILGPLGAGGMGEVYLARDTRLDREVAIKVLPDEFAEDEERLRRFEREAKVLASLNHPNIAGIHGMDQVDSTFFIAMELVPGEDLSERIEQGALEVEEALDVCRQIATGLEAAHEAGVVHRDLKPANIRSTAAGVVKILDFGLAKPMHPGMSKEGSSTAQSDSFAMTAEGRILGTPTYMSPEQARGKPIDRRTDIWAFGCVLFECLAGKRAFGGDNFSDVTAAILRGEPEWALLDGRVSASVIRLLKRCLEKDPTKRIRDMGDVGLEIDELLSGDPSALVHGSAQSEGTGPQSSRMRVVALVVLGLVAGIAGSVLLGDASKPAAISEAPEDSPAMRLAIHLERHQELKSQSHIAFAPDGESIVFCGLENGQRMLFRRRLDEAHAIPITGTEGGQRVFLSLDGRWVGFATNTDLMKVPAGGGRPFRIGPSTGAGGGTWLEDGTIVFSPVYSSGLCRVSAEGGTPAQLTTPDRAGGELGHWWPRPLPGGRWVIYTGFRTPVDTSHISVLDLETGESRTLIEGGFDARYVETGHLLYGKGTRLYALPFDPVTATVTGAALVVLDDVSVEQINGTAVVSVSKHGTLAYVTVALGDPLRELVWFDRGGAASPAIDEQRRYKSVSLAPDDSQVALTIQGESQDIWTYSFERKTLSRLTSGPDTESGPVWSRDGSELFYVVDRPPFELNRIGIANPDSGLPIWDEIPDFDCNQISVSPDGSTVAFARSGEGFGSSLYARKLDGSESAWPIRADRARLNFPSLSPEGNWVVYQSSETGREEIYIESLSGLGGREQLSAGGGMEPLWAGNGDIFYRHAGHLYVCTTRIGESFEFDPPERLIAFESTDTSSEVRSYSVSADGERILAVTTPDASRPRQIEIIPNWTRELERLFAE
ncbi:MAG: Tol biopolymer transport system component [Planctomycetota bacterium]|jgi:Tol biopolymer transport system component